MAVACEHHNAAKITLALSTGQVLCWGVLYYSFGVFVLPIQAELHLSRGQVAAAMSIAWAVAALASIPVGRCIDRYGPRRIILLGATAAPLLVILWSYVHSLFALYVVWSMIGVAMTAVFYEPAFAALVRSGHEAAIGVVTLAGAAAGAIFAPASALLISLFGWRPALVILALILALAPPLLRRHLPANEAVESTAPHPSTEPASRRGRLALVSITFGVGLASAASVALAVHIVPLLVEAGYDAPFASLMLGTMSLASIPGRAIYLLLQRKWSADRLLLAAVTLSAIAITALLAPEARLGVAGFAVVFGLANSVKTPALAATIARHSKPHLYGAASGPSAFVTRAAKATAPALIGVVRTIFGDYRAAVVALGVALSAAAIAIAMGLRDN